MNTQAHSYQKKRNRTLRSTIVILSLIIAGSFATNSAFSQVRVDAQIGIGSPAPVIYERDYPGYAYYAYPAWRGHYRDRIYYAHYRPVFYREHRGYFAGRRFDHARFERETHWRGGHGPARGGYRGHDRGHDDRRH